jgi:hypothetical protein
MGKHAARHARPSKRSPYRYPVLAASAAVLAAAGVGWILLEGGHAAAASADRPVASVSSVSAGGGHAAAASSATTIKDTTPTATPAGTSTPSPGGSGQYFGLAPVDTSLPRSDAYCASHVQTVAERIPANATANGDTPPAGTDFHWGPWVNGKNRGLAANFAHVDGNFSGTTDEILEWAACKWGWSQDYAKAEAVVESHWQQSEVSDDGLSFGILQVRSSPAGGVASANTGWGGYPWTEQSTALDADAQMAYLRACYDGDTPWLGNGYHAGDAWGCIGSWFSGDWYSAAADGYISQVQAALASQAWLKL